MADLSPGTPPDRPAGRLAPFDRSMLAATLADATRATVEARVASTVPAADREAQGDGDAVNAVFGERLQGAPQPPAGFPPAALLAAALQPAGPQPAAPDEATTMEMGTTILRWQPADEDILPAGSAHRGRRNRTGSRTGGRSVRGRVAGRRRK